jgi:hypothetical protein
VHGVPGLHLAHSAFVTTPEHATANAAVGAVNDDMIGSAITDANPIFFNTERRLSPANFDAMLFSKSLRSANWSIASQIKSSSITLPVCFSN